jgi:murein DD-endopeptidase MepM/ murein hydrolase activator NlpD
MTERLMSSEPRPQSRFWRILLYLAAGLVLVVAGALAVMFALGGTTRMTAWYYAPLVLPLAGLVALVVAIANLIARRRLTRPAALVGGLGLLALLPAILLVRPATYPASIERTEPSATVRLPSDAPLTVAWGGDSVTVNAHAATSDQRWAYDLVVDPYFHGSANLEDYGCYGVEVVAPTAGEVVEAHDGEPEETPGAASNNFTAPEGNHVSLRLPNDTYLIIAHLKTGSVRVAVGDVVKEGQPLGECGNSGNTSEPHIHIHLQRQDPRETPLNFADGLPLYFRDHVDAAGNPGPAMPSGGFRMEGEEVIPLGPTLRHVGE